LNRACAFLLLAGMAAAPLALASQELEAQAAEGSLAIRFNALITDRDGKAGGEAIWREESFKYTLPGVPVGVKIVGSNLIVMTQVTPFDRGDGSLTLVAQGQIWLRNPLGGLSFRTTLETVTVEFGETLFFYPLGMDSEGRSPLRLEITVSRRAAASAATAPSAPGAAALPVDASIER